MDQLKVLATLSHQIEAHFGLQIHERCNLDIPVLIGGGRMNRRHAAQLDRRSHFVIPLDVSAQVGLWRQSSLRARVLPGGIVAAMSQAAKRSLPCRIPLR